VNVTRARNNGAYRLCSRCRKGRITDKAGVSGLGACRTNEPPHLIGGVAGHFRLNRFPNTGIRLQSPTHTFGIGDCDALARRPGQTPGCDAPYQSIRCGATICEPRAGLRERPERFAHQAGRNPGSKALLVALGRRSAQHPLRASHSVPAASRMDWSSCSTCAGRSRVRAAFSRGARVATCDPTASYICALLSAGLRSEQRAKITRFFKCWAHLMKRHKKTCFVKFA
jgi:hypothetical protein